MKKLMFIVFLVCLAIAGSKAHAADIAWRNGVVFVTGELDLERDPTLFHETIDNAFRGYHAMHGVYPNQIEVDLDSHGGNIGAAEQMVDELAQARTRYGNVPILTLVTGTCSSACTVIFAAGQYRWKKPGAHMAVHNAGAMSGSVDTSPTESTTAMSATTEAATFEMAWLLGHMGAPDSVIAKTIKAPNAHPVDLDEADFAAWGVRTTK